MNSAEWYAKWIHECWRLLASTGYLMMFGNWRSIPTYLRAFSMLEINVDSCLIWNKDIPGLAGIKQLRPSYEIVLIAAKPGGRISNRSARDIFACQWNTHVHGKHGHSAEKPVVLLKHLIELVTQAGDCVYDPFMGSGSTGVAAIESGRTFIGCEYEKNWYNTTKKRLDDAWQLKQI